MSDTSQGSGWWQASDGKWYRPEQHPDYQPPSPGSAWPLQGPPSLSQASGAGAQTPQSEATEPTQTFGSQPQPAKEQSQDWYRRTWVIVVALIVFFPVGLALMWMSGWKMPTKIVVSAAFVALVVLSAATSKPASKNTRTVAITSNTQAPTTTAAPAPTTTAAPAPTTTTVPPAPPVPTRTQQQQSAVKEAKQYLSMTAFSQQGLIDQLDSSAGSGYSVNDATVAVDSLTVDWNAEALQAAKAYLAIQAFSCSDLIQQLDSSAGDKYTVAQATYGATQAGDC